MTARSKVFCSGLLVLLCCSGAPSDDKVPDKSMDAAKKLLAALAKAYNASDAKAIGEQFTPGGEFVDGDDNVFQGREAIIREFAALFENNPKGAVELAVDDVREISPGVLAVDCTGTFPGGEGAEPTEVDLSALVVKQADGRWLLASVRSEGETSVRTPHTRLKQLEWLIGEWLDESDESTMHTTTRWSDDGNFILTDFTIRVAGRSVMTGTQRIGWDASLEKFKSWVFDSEGGHAEGIWTELDDRWVVKATGVNPEGDACSATHTYEQSGPDAFRFMVTDRIVGDDSEPDFIAKVVRKPPDPEGKATASAEARRGGTTRP